MVDQIRRPAALHGIDILQKQESGEYTVRSVYYDTPGFHCYQEKMDGVKVRKKFRIRGYNQPAEDSIVFLEIKRKYENFIEKNRAPLLYKDLEALLASPDLDKYIISFSKSDK
jgi:SPX domain protein involved in polyphosphate accumulation